MSIFQAGQLNTTALSRPGLYIQIVSPQIANLNGVPTNKAAFVGTATWGPVNSPVLVSGTSDYVPIFGNPQPRAYDMGTQLALAVMQGGAGAYAMVRVTDGNDKKASGLIGTTTTGGNGVIDTAGSGYVQGTTSITCNAPQTTGGTQAVYSVTVTSGAISAITETTPGTGYTSPPILTVVGPNTGPALAHAPALVTTSEELDVQSLYTGSGGNGTAVTISAGSKAATHKVVVSAPGFRPETFDNIAGTGNAFWLAAATAINTGATAFQGPSRIVRATAGGGSAAPSAQTVTLQGGTDGATNVTAAMIVGEDVQPRSGMYALRGSGVSVAALCDVTDNTHDTDQVAFGLGEGVYMIGVGPRGENAAIATAIAAKQTAGTDSYSFVKLLGDYVTWNDPFNAVTRVVNPQGFKVGVLANLDPSQSSLNKPIQGVVATDQSTTGQPYSDADLDALAAAGMDVLCNPIPAGDVFGFRTGRNSSSNAVIHGDNYTRMTNYIASTLNKGVGKYVGAVNNPNLKDNAIAVVNAFLSNLADQGLISAPDGTVPYQVTIPANLNPPSQVALGYLYMVVQVVYASIIEYFIVNLEGGQSVTITRSSVIPANQNYGSNSVAA